MKEDFIISLIMGLIVTVLVLISIIRDKRKKPETWFDKFNRSN